MPSAGEILAGLTEVANQAFAVAVAWHLAIAVAVVALAFGWRPSRRLAGVLLASPAVSVAALALAHGNAFNGIVFTVIAVVLVILALRLGDAPVAFPRARWAVIAGVPMVTFGWFYPHFLESRPDLAYLYGAPTGLVPCPTLSLMIGFTLLAGGLGSRAWSLVLGLAGVFYGVFGAIPLGVRIDLILLAGSIALVVLALLPEHRREPALSPSL